MCHSIYVKSPAHTHKQRTSAQMCFILMDLLQSICISYTPIIGTVITTIKIMTIATIYTYITITCVQNGNKNITTTANIFCKQKQCRTCCTAQPGAIHTRTRTRTDIPLNSQLDSRLDWPRTFTRTSIANAAHCVTGRVRRLANGSWPTCHKRHFGQAHTRSDDTTRSQKMHETTICAGKGETAELAPRLAE